MFDEWVIMGIEYTSLITEIASQATDRNDDLQPLRAGIAADHMKVKLRGIMLWPGRY
jgi:hypothetical protein